jgi:hypothetical protein
VRFIETSILGAVFLSGFPKASFGDQIKSNQKMIIDNWKILINAQMSINFV